jgi:hypothetical protein
VYSLKDYVVWTDSRCEDLPPLLFGKLLFASDSRNQVRSYQRLQTLLGRELRSKKSQKKQCSHYFACRLNVSELIPKEEAFQNAIQTQELAGNRSVV